MRIVFCDKCASRTQHACVTCGPTGKTKALIELAHLAATAAPSKRPLIGFCATSCNPRTIGHHKQCYYWLWNEDGTLRSGE